MRWGPANDSHAQAESLRQRVIEKQRRELEERVRAASAPRAPQVVTIETHAESREERRLRQARELLAVTKPSAPAPTPAEVGARGAVSSQSPATGEPSVDARAPGSPAFAEREPGDGVDIDRAHQAAAAQTPESREPRETTCVLRTSDAAAPIPDRADDPGEGPAVRPLPALLPKSVGDQVRHLALLQAIDGWLVHNDEDRAWLAAGDRDVNEHRIVVMMPVRLVWRERGIA